jgi:hypothetical protein
VLNDGDDSLFVVKDMTAATDGKMYFLCKQECQGDATFRIESREVATGNLIMSKNLTMAQPPSSNISGRLSVSGNHLLLFLIGGRGRVWPDSGLGVYSFSRMDLAQTCFLPCFSGGAANAV